MKDDTMPGGVPVRSGALCCVPIVAMNRNPRLHPEANVFKPERWEGKELPGEFEMPTFWAGPRLCLGRLMAQTEVMVVGGLLAKQFKLDVVNQKGYTMSTGPVWFYREGLNVRVGLCKE